jgi:adenosylcobinamide-GDP ribazoletransferase
MSNFWRSSFYCAVSFLTIIKLPQRLTKEAVLSSATYTFAFVGLALGLGLMLLSLCGAVAPFLMLLFLCVITGFLHVDGLADTCDAFFSSRGKEKMLEIMKDSRIGTMGAAAIILALAGKFYAFVMLDSSWVLIFIPAVSRFAMVLLLYRMPYVRTAGTGHSFVVAYRPEVFAQIVPVVILMFIFLGPITAGALVVAFIVIYTLVELWYQRKIGGITGDLTGALCELMETGLFLVAIAL